MWADLKVAHLFKPHSKQWNIDFIHYVFDPGTAQKILATPLLSSVRTDAPTWRFEKDGKYSVRSAYRDIINNDQNAVQHRVAGHWNMIWKLKLPPKVKNFLWRVCRNCLPTRNRLHQRGVPCPTVCSVCDEYDEDINHLFFYCSKSIGCWQRVGLWHTIQQNWQITLPCTTNIFAILQHLDTSQKHIFGVTLWSLWKHRNNKVWNDRVETIHTICERGGSLLQSWKNAQEVRNLGSNSMIPSASTQWTKPSEGRYKCNVDASFSHSLNKVGIGVCIRDEEGRFVIAKTEWIAPVLEVDMGEALGLLSALQWVRDLQLVHMDFETDSKTVVDNIYGRSIGVSNYMAVIQECRHLLSDELANSDVKFIRRQANGVAHSLARVAPCHASFQLYLDIPSCISSIIINEMR